MNTKKITIQGKIPLKEVLVITSYPNPTHGKFGQRDFNAMGEHAERRLPYLSEKCRVIVAAEKSGSVKEFKVSKNLVVKRLWEKGNSMTFFSVLWYVFQRPTINSIFVQFEFNVLGGIIPNLVLLFILFLLRLMGKTIVFEVHQVITDIKSLRKHIHITNPLLVYGYNNGLALYYTLLGLISHTLIVFEEELKQRLSQFIKKEKITLLSLSVDTQNTLSTKKAKQIVGIPHDTFVVLQFGYFNGYKGLDFSIPTLGKAALSHVQFIVAGGENPYLRHTKKYQQMYHSLVASLKEYPHIIHTGFVPDNKVSLYFSAADVVIFPYEVFMSASGPFSRALAYQKPFLLSEKLSLYQKSADFSESMKQSGLTHKDIFFQLHSPSFLSMITKAKNDKKYYAKLEKMVQILAEKRSIKTVTEKLYPILFPKPTNTSSFLPIPYSISHFTIY